MEFITNQLFDIQASNTNKKQTSIPTTMSSHPWTENKRCKAIFKLKVPDKIEFINAPTFENQIKLKIAHTNLHLLYNRLKLEYYNKMFDNVGNNYKNFYDIISLRESPPVSYQLL